MQLQLQLPKTAIAKGATCKTAYSGGPILSYSFGFDRSNRIQRVVEEGPQISEMQSTGCQLEAGSLASLAGRPLSSIEADWHRICLFIYASDRCAPRKPLGKDGPEFLPREMSVCLPLLEPEHWRPLAAQFETLLGFLTGDTWRMEFCQGERTPMEQLMPIYPQTDLDEVVLFSGGLDSLTGLAAASGKSKRVGLVSGRTNNRLGTRQDLLRKNLEKEHGFHLMPVAFDYGLKHVEPSSGFESTQRTRGLIHVGLGLLAAHLAGVPTLKIYENGIGAFNFACDSGQVHWQTSKSVHPLFVFSLTNLAMQALESKLAAHNPFLNQTKGQMTKKALETLPADLLLESISCEIFPNYLRKVSQCGICPSCLIRRAALHSAGVGESGADYSHDILRSGLPGKLHQRVGFLKLEKYARRWSNILNAESVVDGVFYEYPEFAEHSIQTSEALGLGENQLCEKLVRLHVSFLNEWGEFSAQIPGYHLTYPHAA